jgi:flavin-dependent dehydrogenase
VPVTGSKAEFSSAADRASLHLNDGSRVAIIGAGPAGSFCASFLLSFAERVGRSLQVDIYEPRDFWGLGPASCNMCGGIVSESLVQNLALEGIELPERVVQRGLDSYVLHTAVGSCRIDTPLHEQRIATVHRGGGPRGAVRTEWGSFDAHLLKLAIARGARYLCARVTGLTWDAGKPQLQFSELPPQTYDLVVGAAGLKTSEATLFEGLGFGYQVPRSVKAYISELALGGDAVRDLFGSAMHVFLLDLPRLDFAALIPKGDYVTACLLGRDIDKELVASFFAHPAVKQCFPPGWSPAADACHCTPRMFFGSARSFFADRVVLIGDSGVSRLYKDGIGAAYRTAKAAARTAVFSGVSAGDFRAVYWRECRRLAVDNLLGRAIFTIVHVVRRFPVSSAAILRLVGAEKLLPAARRRMSGILWDTFTGSAPYRSILRRGLNPGLLLRLGFAHIPGLLSRRRQPADGAPVSSG